MGKRKIICMMLIMTIGLSLLATGVGARESCDMGRCRHHARMDFQHAAVTAGIMSKDCCPEPQRDPCDLDKGQKSVVNECAIRASRASKSQPEGAVVAVTSCLTSLSSAGSNPKIHVGSTTRTSLIYLHNLSLII